MPPTIIYNIQVRLVKKDDLLTYQRSVEKSDSRSVPPIHGKMESSRVFKDRASDTIGVVARLKNSYAHASVFGGSNNGNIPANTNLST